MTLIIIVANSCNEIIDNNKRNIATIIGDRKNDGESRSNDAQNDNSPISIVIHQDKEVDKNTFMSELGSVTSSCQQKWVKAC